MEKKIKTIAVKYGLSITDMASLVQCNNSRVAYLRGLDYEFTETEAYDLYFKMLNKFNSYIADIKEQLTLLQPFVDEEINKLKSMSDYGKLLAA